MKAFVTGSTGLLGNSLVRTLLEAGHEVCALADPKKKRGHNLADTAGRIIIGDIRNVADFAYQLKGVDCCLPYRGLFPRILQAWEPFRRVLFGWSLYSLLQNRSLLIPHRISSTACTIASS
jgi:hypothetical protein